MVATDLLLILLAFVAISAILCIVLGEYFYKEVDPDLLTSVFYRTYGYGLVGILIIATIFIFLYS